MISFNLDSPATYRRTLALYGGDMAEAFTLAVQKILVRYFAQNDAPAPPESALLAFGRQLWEIANRHGLPAPLAPADQGSPLDLSDGEADQLIADAVSTFPLQSARPALAVAARELLRGIIQPEFKKCRLSYKEPREGASSCERQDPALARARPSGAHCADCPYWTQLSSEKNEKLLLKEWDQSRVDELTAQLGVFLPEDFRSLRKLIHLHVRFGRRG